MKLLKRKIRNDILLILFLSFIETLLVTKIINVSDWAHSIVVIIWGLAIIYFIVQLVQDIRTYNRWMKLEVKPGKGTTEGYIRSRPESSSNSK